MVNVSSNAATGDDGVFAGSPPDASEGHDPSGTEFMNVPASCLRSPHDMPPEHELTPGSSGLLEMTRGRSETPTSVCDRRCKTMPAKVRRRLLVKDELKETISKERPKTMSECNTRLVDKVSLEQHAWGMCHLEGVGDEPVACTRSFGPLVHPRKNSFPSRRKQINEKVVQPDAGELKLYGLQGKMPR